MPTGLHRCGGQRGFLLVELMVAAAVALLLAVWMTHEWAQRTRDLQAQALAVWMRPVQRAAQDYLARHRAALSDATQEASLAALGYANWRQPRLEELRADQLLPADWPATGPLGQTLGLLVLRDGICPGATCRVRALVHTGSPLLQRQGLVDEAFIAQWLQATRAHGAVVWPGAPGILTGPGLRLALSGLEPAQAWLPGTVALLVQAESGGGVNAGGAIDLQAYLRVGDARDPDFQGSATIQGTVRSGARLVAAESLVLEAQQQALGACAPQGAVTRNAAEAGLLICMQGYWRPAARSVGGAYLFNTLRGCVNSLGISTANPMTGYCGCGMGYYPTQVSESGSMKSSDGLTTGFLCLPN